MTEIPNREQREVALCAVTEERTSFTLKWQQEMTLWPCPLLTRSLLELPTVCDSDPLGGSPRPGTERLHFLDHFHSFGHAAKDNMLAIQPIWTKRRFIIAPSKLRQSVVHPSGFDSWLFVGWYHSGKDSVFWDIIQIIPFCCFGAKT